MNRKEIIEQIEIKTGLFFQSEIADSNVCFANFNEELRDEYKLSFNSSDLNYFLKLFKDVNDLPTNAEDFWEKVKQAKSL